MSPATRETRNLPRSRPGTASPSLAGKAECPRPFQETLGAITGVLDEAIDLGRTLFGGKKPAGQPDPKSGSGDPCQKALEGLQDPLGGKK